MTFRIFTNDRGAEGGVYKYSCFAQIKAPNAFVAVQIAKRRTKDLPYATKPHGAPAVVRWPLSDASEEEREWVQKHV